MIIKNYIGGLLLSLFIWCESAAGEELSWYTRGASGTISGITATAVLSSNYDNNTLLSADISAYQLCMDSRKDSVIVDSYNLGVYIRAYYHIGLILGMYNDIEICSADNTCQTFSGEPYDGPGYTLIEYNGKSYFTTWYAQSQLTERPITGSTLCNYFPSSGIVGFRLSNVLGRLAPGNYTYRFMLNNGQYGSNDSVYYSSFSDIAMSRSVGVAETNQYLVTVTGTLNVVNSCMSNTNELVFDVGSISAASLPVEVQKVITISCGYQNTGTIKLLGVSDGKIDMEGGVQAGISVALNNNVLSLNENDTEIELSLGANALTIIATVMRDENEDITAGEHTGSAVLQITYS